MSNKELLIREIQFRDIAGLEYFDFEEDFVEGNMRCIPMIVRFKMDAAGIKLKLKEWSRFNSEERIELAIKGCNNEKQIRIYHEYLAGLIKKYTKKPASLIPVDTDPQWANLELIPLELEDKAREFNWNISLEKWKALTDLQRFTLLKLCRPGHENKNFPKAINEFGLHNDNSPIKQI